MKQSLIAMAVLGAFAPAEDHDAGGAASATLLDLNTVLDTAIDGVADAPEFVIPPEGKYMLECKDAKVEKYKVTVEGKEENRVRIKLLHSVVQTHELSDPEEQPVPTGSLISEQFMTNEQGLSYFKRQAKNILGEENIKGATIGDILKELPNNHQYNATVKVKKTQGTGRNQGKVFENVQVRITSKGEVIPMAEDGTDVA